MIRDLLNLIRWPNLIFIGIILWTMEYWVAQPVMHQIYFDSPLPWWLMMLMMIATLSVAAGGYIINDYFDVKIDRINRPDRLIVTRTISKDTTMLLFQIFTGVGIAAGLLVAGLCRSVSLAMVFVLVPGLLWFYSSSYKRQLIVGNLIIATTSAITPLLVAMVHVAYAEHQFGDIVRYTGLTTLLYQWLGGFALFAFLTTLVREVIKDMQDQMGDREMECHTLPIMIGETWTKVIVTSLILLIAGVICYLQFAVLPFNHTWHSLATRYVVFGLIIPLACELYLLWSAHIPSDYRNAQTLMKFIMFIGTLFSFVIFKLL